MYRNLLISLIGSYIYILNIHTNAALFSYKYILIFTSTYTRTQFKINIHHHHWEGCSTFNNIYIHIYIHNIPPAYGIAQPTSECSLFRLLTKGGLCLQIEHTGNEYSMRIDARHTQRMRVRERKWSEHNLQSK